MSRLFVIKLGIFIAAWSSLSQAQAEPLRLASTGSVAGLLQRLEESFVAQAPQRQVETIPGLGSAGAIAAVAAGAIDLAISSRDINDKEREQGVISRPLFETPYLFVSSISSPLSLSDADVLGYFAGKTMNYPNGEPVRLVLRPRNDSNTLYITGVIPGMSAALEQARHRHDLPVASTDQDNMQHMKSIPGAFSGMTLTQLASEPNTLQRVRLNNVEGTLETMVSGAYPLKLVMFTVTGTAPNAATQAFMAYLTSPEGRAIIEQAGGRFVAP